MKRILVTGGSGFIGSHLCKKLVEDKNNYVYCLDNFYTGSKNNIKDLLELNNFELTEQDIVNPIDINVDEIYNLACPASPVHYQKDPIKTIKASVIGIINILEMAIKYNSKILQASTSEVYGDPLIHPQNEMYWGNVNPIGIRSCYDEGKRCAETIIADYRRQYNLDAKIVRIFNTYGPNMAINDGRVISNFIVQALKNNDITIYGDGSQTRSFCYVSDMIDGLIKMMNSKQEGPINLGNPTEKSIKELAGIVLKLTNSRSKITYRELPSDDPIKRKPDIKMAKNFLDWEPKTDLNTGLSKTTEYFKNLLS